MGVFDHTARRAAKREPAGFFRWLLPRLDPTLTFAGWLDTRTSPSPPESELTCDILAELLAKDRPAELSRCVLPWVALMRGSGEAATIEEWKRLADLEPDPRLRLDYAVDALLFAELSDVRGLWKQALEGWNVRVSQQVLEWQHEARVEAELKTQRANLLLALETRVQGPVPSDLTETIQTTEDMDLLSRWFRAALKANSLDEFRAAVQR